MTYMTKATTEALQKAAAAMTIHGTAMPPEDDFTGARLDMFQQQPPYYPQSVYQPGAVGSTYSYYSGTTNGACTCSACAPRVSDWGGNLIATLQASYERQEYLRMLTGVGVTVQANLWLPEDEPKEPPEPPQPSWNNKRKLDLD